MARMSDPQPSDQSGTSTRLDLDDLGDFEPLAGLEDDDYSTPSRSSNPDRPTMARVASLTNSPGAMPGARTKAAQLPIRRVRTVRVDAWSEPASVSWGSPSKRMRSAGKSVGKSVGKVSRASRSTDWALPF